MQLCRTDSLALPSGCWWVWLLLRSKQPTAHSTGPTTVCNGIPGAHISAGRQNRYRTVDNSIFNNFIRPLLLAQLSPSTTTLANHCTSIIPSRALVDEDGQDLLVRRTELERRLACFRNDPRRPRKIWHTYNLIGNGIHVYAKENLGENLICSLSVRTH